MKRSKLTEIIKEEVKRHFIIEGIVDSLVMMFLSPKVKKDVDKLKNSPEWIEIVHKLNTTRSEMEMYNKRAEEYLKKCKELEAQAKKQGYKISNCDPLEKSLKKTKHFYR